MLVRNLESMHIRKVEYYILMYATMWTTRLNTLIIYLNHIYQLIIINHKYQIKLSISLLRSVNLFARGETWQKGRRVRENTFCVKCSVVWLPIKTGKKWKIHVGPTKISFLPLPSGKPTEATNLPLKSHKCP